MRLKRSAFSMPWSASMMRDSLCAAHTRVWGLIDAQEQLIAFVVFSVALDEAELLTMAVDPQCQRQGFGEKLLECVTKLLQLQRIKQLHLEVRASNQAARKLYEKTGFAAAGVRKNYYPLKADAQREDAILMTRAL